MNIRKPILPADTYQLMAIASWVNAKRYNVMSSGELGDKGLISKYENGDWLVMGDGGTERIPWDEVRDWMRKNV